VLRINLNDTRYPPNCCHSCSVQITPHLNSCQRLATIPLLNANVHVVLCGCSVVFAFVVGKRICNTFCESSLQTESQSTSCLRPCSHRCSKFLVRYEDSISRRKQHIIISFTADILWAIYSPRCIILILADSGIQWVRGLSIGCQSSTSDTAVALLVVSRRHGSNYHKVPAMRDTFAAALHPPSGRGLHKARLL
jgi:hypothetical protein